MRKGLVWLAFGAAALALGGMAARKLRVARDTRSMVPDRRGNYDIDGVSYDSTEHEVVVSGDYIREETVHHHRGRLPI